MLGSGKGTGSSAVITVLFIALLFVVILYLVRYLDGFCALGMVLSLLLGIAVIYDIITSSKTTETAEEYMHRQPITPSKPLNEILTEEEKKEREAWEEDAEADEDLFIAYEAMNDWEDFEGL